MFPGDTFLLLLLLIPVAIVGLVTGGIIYLIIKTDKETLEKEKACAAAGTSENISHENVNHENVSQLMDSIQVSIFKLRETIERIKKQTDAINSLSLSIQGRLAGETASGLIEVPGGAKDSCQNPLPADDSPLPPELSQPH